MYHYQELSSASHVPTRVLRPGFVYMDLLTLTLIFTQSTVEEQKAVLYMYCYNTRGEKALMVEDNMYKEETADT